MPRNSKTKRTYGKNRSKGRKPKIKKGRTSSGDRRKNYTRRKRELSNLDKKIKEAKKVVEENRMSMKNSGVGLGDSFSLCCRGRKCKGKRPKSLCKRITNRAIGLGNLFTYVARSYPGYEGRGDAQLVATNTSDTQVVGESRKGFGLDETRSRRRRKGKSPKGGRRKRTRKKRRKRTRRKRGGNWNNNHDLLMSLGQDDIRSGQVFNVRIEGQSFSHLPIPMLLKEIRSTPILNATGLAFDAIAGLKEGSNTIESVVKDQGHEWNRKYSWHDDPRRRRVPNVQKEYVFTPFESSRYGNGEYIIGEFFIDFEIKYFLERGQSFGDNRTKEVLSAEANRANLPQYYNNNNNDQNLGIDYGYGYELDENNMEVEFD